jgi:hypothetical protein
LVPYAPDRDKVMVARVLFGRIAHAPCVEESIMKGQIDILPLGS